MASNTNALRLVDELRELPSKPRSHVLLILVFMLFNGFVLASNSVVLPIYLRDATKMSVTQVSLLLSEVVALFAVTQAVVGFLVDIGVRLVGRKWMLLRVAIIRIVGWLLLVAAPTRFGLWIVGFLFGLGAGATPLALSVLADNTPVSKAGLFANIMTSCAVVGQFLAMIASVVVIGTVGARWYYTIDIVPFALIFLVMLFKLPDAPRPSSAGGVLALVPRSWRWQVTSPTRRQERSKSFHS